MTDDSNEIILQPLRPESCPKCKFENDPDTAFCKRCDFDLTYGRLRPFPVCLYCNIKRSPSKEHVFGSWLNKAFPHAAGPRQHHLLRPRKLMFWKPPVMEKATTQKVARRPYDLTVKNVCEVCNNTWMSKIQQDASCIITDLAKGKWPSLNLGDRKIIARWCAMITVNLESKGNVSTITQSQRSSLMNGEVPNGFHVFMGNLDNNKSAGNFHHEAFKAPIKLGNGYISVQYTYFIVEKAVFHTYSCFGSKTFEMLKYVNGWSPEDSPLALIWPDTCGATPIQPRLTFYDIKALQNAVTGKV